ncbi:hypothetical protein DFJ74DRAFT_696909 [Hyaloraphidium curvatum]|nr:hypothetical protein DFJ74DRAFT_696909 [Hyaloraphidium curvatum]
MSPNGRRSDAGRMHHPRTHGPASIARRLLVIATTDTYSSHRDASHPSQSIALDPVPLPPPSLPSPLIGRRSTPLRIREQVPDRRQLPRVQLRQGGVAQRGEVRACHCLGGVGVGGAGLLLLLRLVLVLERPAGRGGGGVAVGGRRARPGGRVPVLGLLQRRALRGGVGAVCRRRAGGGRGGARGLALPGAFGAGLLAHGTDAGDALEDAAGAGLAAVAAASVNRGRARSVKVEEGGR